ncbi:MAG: tetratricopeptide repeat protein [Bacteroidales bacterium]|nr:tetratricopeptide repeat protein [Bacteroidales bacterium]
MKVKLLLVLVIITMYFKGYTQDSKIDSLSRLISTSADDNEKAKLLFMRSKSYPASEVERNMADASEALILFKKSNNFQGQVDAMVQISNVYARQNKFPQALETSQKALELARQHDYPVGQAYALNNIGRNLAQMGKLEEAGEAYKEAVRLMSKSGNEKELADIYNRMGIMYFRSSNFNRAIECLDSAAMIASKYNIELLLAYIYMNKANNLSELTRYDEALDYHLKSIAIKEKLKDQKGLLQSYNNMGNIYNLLDQPDKASDYYRESIKVASKLENKVSLGLSYSNLAVALEKMNRNDSLDYFFGQSIANFEQTSDKAGLALACHNYGNTLLNQNEYKKSDEYLTKALTLRREIKAPFDIASTLHLLGRLEIDRGNLEKAEQYLQEALILIEDENGKREADILKTISIVFRERGKLQQAYSTLEDYVSLKDSIITESKLLKVQQLQADYDMLKKEAELVLEKKDNEIHRLAAIRQKSRAFLLFIISILMVSLAVILVIVFLKKKKYADKLMQKNSKIEALNKEIHHRVKNNLQIVSGLLTLHSIQTEDSKTKQAIDEGRTRLDSISLLHQRLYQSDSVTQVEIREYIENLAALIAGSFGLPTNKITTKVNLDNTYMDVDYAVPIGLIVNELVTNAFKHATVDEPSGLTILVDLHKKDRKRVELVVSDNGLPKENKTGIAENTSFGMTLINTLVRQLDGNMSRSYHNGTVFTIDFTMN